MRIAVRRCTRRAAEILATMIMKIRMGKSMRIAATTRVNLRKSVRSSDWVSIPFTTCAPPSRRSSSGVWPMTATR